MARSTAEGEDDSCIKSEISSESIDVCIVKQVESWEKELENSTKEVVECIQIEKKVTESIMECATVGKEEMTAVWKDETVSVVEKDETCIVGDSIPAPAAVPVPASASLQEQFASFRKQRFEKMKHARYLQSKKADARRTLEFKEELRVKFISKCRSYFGVPYHQRYWSEGESHHKAPLYLDCCGLIRQVIYDLREDFGFSLGRWNQAYQFDLCPNELTFEQMRPGDLIFYSATYYNPKLKPFPHKMVHVEVFTGGESGKQTIGARWQKGFVQFHDSYEFTSKNYYDIQFHFRSLDTWLDGTCRSHCTQHPWRDDRDLWVPDKFSVFADDPAAASEAAGEADPVEFDGEEAESSSSSSEVKKLKKAIIKDVFVGKGNNDGLIRSYFTTKEDFRLLDASKAFTTKFAFKWVQTSQEIDFFSFTEGQQIVNHIPNINVFTSKVGLVNTLKTYEASLQQAHQTPLIYSRDFFPESYQLDMLSDEVAFLTQEEEKKSVWILKPHNNNMGKGILMIADIVTFKKEFIAQKKHKLGEYTTTFLLNPKDYCDDKAVAEKQQQQQQLSGSDETQEDPLKYPGISHHSIIQRYVANPLLLNKRKFDIRCYALIACMKPQMVLLFHRGYARVCLSEYTLEGVEEKERRHIHLTNAAVQKQHAEYKARKEESIWTIDKLTEYLSTTLGVSQSRQEEVWSNIKSIVKHVINAGAGKLEKKRGQYELLGVDILLDTNLKPYLIEINTNPALFLDTSALKETIPPMMHKVLDIVLAVNEYSGEDALTSSSVNTIIEVAPFESITS